MSSARMLAAAAFSIVTSATAIAQTTAPALSGDQVVERVSPSAVSILVGKGDGQVAARPFGLSWRREWPTMYPEPVVGTRFCSSPRRCRRDPAAECWWIARLGYSESSAVHSASARTSILLCPSTVLPVSAMHLAACALTPARVCNHSAPKPLLLQRLLPTLLQHQWFLPV